jgi:hypothetical protein
MAYSELANQIARALDPHSLPENVLPIRFAAGDATPAFLERLEEEIPAKWLREVERVYVETGEQLARGATSEPAGRLSGG